jgi:hypothetical protein
MDSPYIWIGHCFDILYLNQFTFADIEPYPLTDKSKQTGTKAYNAFTLDQENIGSYSQEVALNRTISSSSKNVMSSTNDYERTLKNSISASFSAPGYSGSLSVSVTSRVQNTLSRREVNTLTTGQRETLQVDLLHEDATSASEVPPIGSSFKDALWAAATANTQDFATFVGKYGTHFASQVTMGGVGRQSFKFSSEDYAKMSELGIDVSAQASAVIKVVEVGGSISSSTQISESFKKAIENQRTDIDFVGGTPGGLNFNDWINTVDDNPVPIKLDLLLNSDLVTTAYFPSKQSAEVSTAKTNLEVKINEYIATNGLNLSDSVINDGDYVCLCAVPATSAKITPSGQLPGMLSQPMNDPATIQVQKQTPAATAAQFTRTPIDFPTFIWQVSAAESTNAGQPIELLQTIKLTNKATSSALNSEGAKPNFGYVSAASGTHVLGTSPNQSDVWSLNGRLGSTDDLSRPINSGDTITLRRLYVSPNKTHDPVGQLQLRDDLAFSNGVRYGTQVIESAMAFQIFKLDIA